MKKIIAVLAMGVIIAIYCFSLKNVGEEKAVAIALPALERLQVIKQSLEKSYPSTPKEVIEEHNQLMLIGYSAEIKDEDFTTYAEVLRMLYSQRLQEVNPIQIQVSGLISERLKNEDNPLIMISNEVLDTTIIKNVQDEEEDSAEVTVKHGTNKGSITKKYLLIKEDGLWKIQSWETQTNEEKSSEHETALNTNE